MTTPYTPSVRCQDAEAFELNSTGFTNGVFVKFLKKRLLDNEKITVVLDRVAEGERSTTWYITYTHYGVVTYLVQQRALIHQPNANKDDV